MDWTTYKRTCERSDCFSRFALDLTRRHAPGAAAYIDSWLASPPVPKPAGHHGGPQTDCFLVDAPAQIIVEWIADLERHWDSDSTDPATRRRLGHLAVVWREYLDFADTDRQQ